MEDVSPRINKAVLQKFHRLLAMDPQIKAYRKKLKAEKMNREDYPQYVNQVAQCASKAAYEAVTSKALPEGILYWNIAEAVLTPLFREVIEIVNDIAIKQVNSENETQGIQVQVKELKFPNERVKSYLNMVVNESLKEVDDETSR